MPTSQTQIRDEVIARIVQALESNLLPCAGPGGRAWAETNRAGTPTSPPIAPTRA